MSLDHHLRAAQGYAELEMFDEALIELRKLPESESTAEQVLQLRLLVLMRKHAWSEALSVCELLREQNPLMTTGYIHGAFCLHETGRTADAKAMLMAGPPSLLQEPTYFYNLGCYDAVLGNVEQALKHLEMSFRMDRRFREIARQDPDLKAVSALLE